MKEKKTKRTKKNIKNTANKLILILIGFISLSVLFILYITRFIKNNYFPDADIKAESDYSETPEVQRSVENYIANMLSIIQGEKSISGLDRDSYILSITSLSYHEGSGDGFNDGYFFYGDNSTSYYSVSDYEKAYGRSLEEMISSAITDSTYLTDNGKRHARYEYFNYSYEEYIGVSDFIRISTDDYLEIIRDYGQPGSQDLYDEYEYVLSGYLDSLDENDTVIASGNNIMVMDSENIYKSNQYGYLDVFDIRVLYENDYVYLPTNLLANDDYLTFEEAILFAPVFDNRLCTLFMALNEYYYNMCQYFYGMSNQYLEADDHAYLYSAGDVYEVYSFPDEEAYGAMGESANYEDIASYIVDNFDIIVSSRTFADMDDEYSYYTDSDGEKHVTSYNVQELIEKAGLENDNLKFMIGFKTGVKSDDTSLRHKKRLLYDFCRIFCPNYYIVFTIVTILFLSSMILLWFAVKKYKYRGDAISIYPIDKSHLEIPFVLWVFMSYISYKSCKPFFRDIAREDVYEGSLTDVRKVIVIILFTLVYFTGISIYCSIIRRVKRRTFISDLIAVKFAKWVNGMFEMASRQGRGGKVAFIRGSMVLLVNIILLVITQIFSISPGVIVLIDIAFVLINLLSLSKTVRNEEGVDRVLNTAKEIGGGNLDAQVDTEGISGSSLTLARTINNMNYALNEAVEKNVRDERMKAELVTNVSHDIKTPLTSIINYVGLIKREEIENEKLLNYVDILESKSQRLKQLIEDLIEASRASSGEIELNVIRLNFAELLNQVVGETVDRFDNKGLEIVSVISKKPVMINADGRHLFRITENILNNAYKYSKENTKVYLALVSDGKEAIMTLENTSVRPIEESPDELMERFVRGDKSRSTEGSGLGLSIAKSLTELMDGKFRIEIKESDFKVIIRFPIAEEEVNEQPVV